VRDIPPRIGAPLPDLLYNQRMKVIRRSIGIRRASAFAVTSVVACGALLAAAVPALAHRASPDAQRVIHVSVDGLRPDAVRTLGPGGAPNFYRLRSEGARTENARTDYDYTNTLPDHTCILTGRAVLGPDGHGITFNGDVDTTIAEVHGSYVAGVFDVAHDNGLGTALFASKSKFSLFDRSWDGVNGAPDLTGPDDGRDKIDRYLYLGDTAALTDSAIAAMRSGTYDYIFLHLRDPDTAGHASGWMSSEYLGSVARIDSLLGLLLDAIADEPLLDGTTAVVVTADHGGAGTDHSDPALLWDYTVPVYVRGPGALPGTDLYQLNTQSRRNPGLARPDYAASPQPIRNGGTSNLALSLLGLPPIPGSTINDAQDLAVDWPTDAGAEGARDRPARVFPNPSGGGTTVSFSLEAESPVEVSVYDAGGRLVRRVVLPRLGRGTHEVDLVGTGLRPGVYFYAVRAGAAASGGKLVIVR